MSQIATLDQTGRFRRYCAVCVRIGLMPRISKPASQMPAMRAGGQGGFRCIRLVKRTVSSHLPTLGELLAETAVLLKGMLMTTRGAAFTDPMRCARVLVFAGEMADMNREHNIRTPSNSSTRFKTCFMFITYRHRCTPFCAI